MYSKIFKRTDIATFWIVLNVIDIYRPPQEILLVPSTPATRFGRTNHPQALNTRYLKRKIKCIQIIKIHVERVWQELDYRIESAASPRVDISSTCKVGQKLGVSLPLLTRSPSA